MVSRVETSASGKKPPGYRRRAVPARAATTAIAAIMLTCAILAATTIRAANSPEANHKPYLLVASPDMPDPTFQQAVILMLPQSEPPLVAGIVINKPTKMTVGQLFSHSQASANQAQVVYFGGPVDLTSAAILIRTTRAPEQATHLFENVYMSSDTGSIRELLKDRQSDKDHRLFLGRAQWTADQLQSEILRGAWIISAATTELVFSPDPAGVWSMLKQQAKLREIEYHFGPRQRPFDLCVFDSVDADGCGPGLRAQSQ